MVTLDYSYESRRVRWTGSVRLNAGGSIVQSHDGVRKVGDMVSLYLNGRCIARNIAVPHRSSPRAVSICLAPGTNYLVMHAEGLCSEPPNTAALVLWADREEHVLVLRSSLRRSGEVRIERMR